MRITAYTVSDLNDGIWEHPAIKGLKRAPRQAAAATSAETASTIRKQVRTSMSSDPRIHALVTSTRRVTACRTEARALLRRSTGRQIAHGATAREFSKKWAGIEHDYHTMVERSYELVSSSKTMAAMAQVAKDIDDVHRFANPAFLNGGHLLLLGELGASVEDLREAYRFAYVPNRQQVDVAIAGLGRRMPTEGRKHIGNLVYLYAPERMLEGGLMTVSGAWTYFGAAVALVSAYCAYLEYLEELKQTAFMNAILFCVLLWVVFDTQHKLAAAQAHLAQLEAQYAEETRLAAAENLSTATSATPASVALDFGYAIGNMSRSKLEVHLPTCSFLDVMRPDNMRTFATLEDARSAGLDNCAYCIGGSMR